MTYSEIQAVNFSTLKHIHRSPKHFRLAVERPHVPPTAAMRLGTAVHQATLTPDQWRPVVCEHLTPGQREALDACNTEDTPPHIYPGAVRRGKEWDAFSSSHKGLIVLEKDYDVIESLIGKYPILTHKEVETASRIRDAVRADSHAMEVLEYALTERVIQWEAMGVRCKGRVDILNPESVWDLKTAAEIGSDRFRWDAAKRLYHVQLSWYACGADRPDAGIIAVESHEPWDVAVYPLPAHVLMKARQIWEGWLERLATCLSTDRWPGQVPEPMALDVPVHLDDEGLDWEEE